MMPVFAKQLPISGPQALMFIKQLIEQIEYYQVIEEADHSGGRSDQTASLFLKYCHKAIK